MSSQLTSSKSIKKSLLCVLPNSELKAIVKHMVVEEKQELKADLNLLSDSDLLHIIDNEYNILNYLINQLEEELEDF